LERTTNRLNCFATRRGDTNAKVFTETKLA
jgi:hypothetical protein